jgi:hypothetical protein
LYYKKIRKDIEDIGFNVNPYDPCIANRMINGKHHTISWHVDDVKSRYIDKPVKDESQSLYASDGIGKVKASRGFKHEYLGMIFEFTSKGS